MKTNNKFLKVTFIYSLIILIGLSFGCQKEVDISGDSRLRVINKIDKKAKVFFDDDLIGRIDANDRDFWSVPSGNHTVKVTAGTLDPYKENIYFPPGQLIELTVEEDEKTATLFVSEERNVLVYE